MSDAIDSLIGGAGTSAESLVPHTEPSKITLKQLLVDGYAVELLFSRVDRAVILQLEDAVRALMANFGARGVS